MYLEKAFAENPRSGEQLNTRYGSLRELEKTAARRYNMHINKRSFCY